MRYYSVRLGGKWDTERRGWFGRGEGKDWPYIAAADSSILDLNQHIVGIADFRYRSVLESDFMDAFEDE